MDALDKLRADLEHWEREEERAEQTLAIARGILPALRKQLEAMTGSPSAERSADQSATARSTVTDAQSAPATPGESLVAAGTPPRFTGEKAIDQVREALAWRSPLTSKDLQDALAAYGRAYGLGAINYALRDLRKEGAITEVGKVGNLVKYRLTNN